jgi:uncharacterized protein
MALADCRSTRLSDPRVSLLFMIPGVGNTLRINGRAEIHADPAPCAEFEVQGRAPRRFYQSPQTAFTFSAERRSCAHGYGARTRKFHARSCLRQVKFSRIYQKGDIDAAEYDRTYPARLKETIY